MKNVPENELLSAYLDGELTADEQAQVERLLAADPEARQLVDELRALSSSVKALPRHEIGRDISEEVVSRAKRQMPTQPAPARAREHESAEDQVPRWRAIVRRVTRPRNFVWSAVAVAVVVLLMVMKPDTLTGPLAPSVAMKSAADADKAAATASPAPSIQAREEAVEVLVAEEAAPAEMPVGGRPAGSTELEWVESEAEEREAAETATRRALAATAPAPAAAPPVAIEQPAKGSPKPRRAGDGYRGGVGGMAGQAGLADDRGRPEAPRVAKREVYKGKAPEAGKKAKASEIGAVAESLPAKAGQRRRRGVRQPDLLLVVSCDVTAEALRGNVFKELLDRHEMTGAMAGGRMLGRISAAEPIGPADHPELGGVAGKPFEVVEVDVEATPGQIKALLAELHDRPSQFPSLSYTLDPGAVSRGLGHLGADGQVAAQRQAGEALYEDVQTVGKPAAAEAAQQKASRADVDKVLDLAWRFRYDRLLRQKAEPSTALGVEAQPVPSRAQKEGKAGTAVSQPPMAPDQQRAEPKLRSSLMGPGAGAARPGAARAFGAQMQSAPPAGPAEARGGAEAQQMPQQEPAEAQPPALPAEGDRFDRDSGRYRVRFVLRVVGPPGGNVAASIAKDAPMIDMASEAAEASPEASPADVAPPQAPAAQATEIER